MAHTRYNMSEHFLAFCADLRSPNSLEFPLGGTRASGQMMCQSSRDISVRISMID